MHFIHKDIDIEVCPHLEKETRGARDTRMRVANVDGLVTLFYDGSRELYNHELSIEWQVADYRYSHLNVNFEEWGISDQCKRYRRERQTWQQIVVVEGVTVIPHYTFRRCENIKRVIFANTVVRIESCAFEYCISLIYIKLDENLEYIGEHAFHDCDLLSVFIPPRCRDIGGYAFYGNTNLAIFNISQDAILGDNAIFQTKLLPNLQFQLDQYEDHHEQHEVQDWLNNINIGEKYSLHRACCAFYPLQEVIMTIITKQGIGAFNIRNKIGITPSQYLKENPYVDIEEMDIVKDYVMKMMGENQS